jgi:hypothetical protein
MDTDHQFEECQLEVIRSWPDTDHPGLMEYVELLWTMGEWGWKQQRNPFTGCVAARTYQLSTGGRSGNEAIISALEVNRPFWELCWVSYRVGGYYEFKIRMTSPSPQGGAGKALARENRENPS